jgi:hypothetical protein
MMNAFSKLRIYCALAGVFATFGCKHEGVGSGLLEKPPPGASAGGEKTEGLVEFVWRSGADPSQGQIEATTPDGRKFIGTFIQPRSQVWSDAYDPYWDVWTSSAWGVPVPWYAGSQDAFLTAYSGKALAHLTSSDGTRMRCLFLLRDPAAGMAGGGEGDCQLSTHERVFGARLLSG